jgi:hypothetical protein
MLFIPFLLNSSEPTYQKEQYLFSEMQTEVSEDELVIFADTSLTSVHAAQLQ